MKVDTNMDKMAASPKSIDEVIFQVIRITAPEVTPVNWAIIATGKTASGENGLWVDSYCVYDDGNPAVVATLESMVGKETKFWDAAEFLTAEWLALDGSWLFKKPIYP